MSENKKHDLLPTMTSEIEVKQTEIYSIVDDNQVYSRQRDFQLNHQILKQLEEANKQRSLQVVNNQQRDNKSQSELHRLDMPAKNEDHNMVERMMKGEDDNKLIDINPQESFQNIKQVYLNFSKAVFIIQQILDQIEIENLLSYAEQSHVEFLFLVWTRVRNYLQTALKQTKEMNITINSKNELSNLQAYQLKAKSKFKIYNKMLDEIRAKLGQKIGKLLHLKKSVGGKEKFLDGFEELDYSVFEQIQFTYNNYIEIVLNSKEIKSQYFINHRFKKVLKGYRKICLLTSEKLTQPKDILTRFNEIITDQ